MRNFRHYIIALVLFVAADNQLACALIQTEAAPVYNSAGALYRAGKFSEALIKYDQLIAQGINNPDVYYNAANAAYRTNKLGVAILYLERALKLAPSDEDAIQNLAFLNSIKQDKEPTEANPVVAFFVNHYSSININSAAFWSGLSFAITILGITAVLFLSGWKRLTAISTAALFGMIFLTSTFTLIEKVHHKNTIAEAVILEDSAIAYSGPGDENTHIFTVHEGTKVVIERRQDSWNLISLKSGAGGWIQADAMEDI